MSQTLIHSHMDHSSLPYFLFITSLYNSDNMGPIIHLTTH